MDEIAEIVGFSADQDTLTVVQADGAAATRSGGSLAWRNHNPGNIKWGPFAKENGAIGPGEGGHAVFPSYESGKVAMTKLLFSADRAYLTLTISEAMAKYAPASDNNDPIAYANYLSRAASVPPSTVLQDLNSVQRDKFVSAMIRMEGYKPGIILAA